MAHDRNSAFDKCFHGISKTKAALELNCRASSGLHHACGVTDSLFDGFMVAPERHVGHDQGPLRTPDNHFCVINHLVKRDRQRCRPALDNGAQGIADQ